MYLAVAIFKEPANHCNEIHVYQVHVQDVYIYGKVKGRFVCICACLLE